MKDFEANQSLNATDELQSSEDNTKNKPDDENEILNNANNLDKYNSYEPSYMISDGQLMKQMQSLDDIDSREYNKYQPNQSSSLIDQS